jgi:hypothetical protein
MNRILVLIVVFSFATCAFAADVIRLNSQKLFDGKILKINDADVVFKMEGKKYVISTSAIYSIDLENGTHLVYSANLNTADEDSTNCLCGEMDAKKLHGKKPQHIVLGMLLGPLAMIGTTIASPNPYSGERTAALSENKELFSDRAYLGCYEKKARRQLIGMEAIGTGVMFAMLTKLLFFSDL